MTKFIDSDYNNGIALLKVSVMNTLHAIDNNTLEEKDYEIMPMSLILNCIKELQWKVVQETWIPSEYFIVVQGEHNQLMCSLTKINDHLIIKKYEFN